MFSYTLGAKLSEHLFEAKGAADGGRCLLALDRIPFAFLLPVAMVGLGPVDAQPVVVPFPFQRHVWFQNEVRELLPAQRASPLLFYADYGIELNLAFVVYQRVGMPLKQFVKGMAPTETRRFPRELIARLGWEMLTALKHVHEAGFLHRDLTPLNVQVNTQGGKDWPFHFYLAGFDNVYHMHDKGLWYVFWGSLTEFIAPVRSNNTVLVI